MKTNSIFSEPLGLLTKNNKQHTRALYTIPDSFQLVTHSTKSHTFNQITHVKTW